MFAREISKEYLIKLGITDVTEDGFHVFKNGVEMKQRFYGGHGNKYLSVNLYDPEIRKLCPIEKRTKGTGIVTLGVHVLNYVWNKGTKLEGFVVDHRDNCPLNNNIDNLQMITQKENSRKNPPSKDRSSVLIKCQLDKPLSFYEDKLTHYKALYEIARKQKDGKRRHSLGNDIWNVKAQIRYWKVHHNEE